MRGSGNIGFFINITCCDHAQKMLSAFFVLEIAGSWLKLHSLELSYCKAGKVTMGEKRLFGGEENADYSKPPKSGIL
jgi:hypothetical protein